MAQTYLNKKQELFCKFLAEGSTQLEAYELAGYQPSSANASTLANQPLVKHRVAELKQDADKREREFALVLHQAKEQTGLGGALDTEITRGVEWTGQRLMDMMGENVRLAQIAGEYKAANECLKMMGDALKLFEKAKADADQGNPTSPKRTLALVSQVADFLADAGGGGDGEEPNALRPRLDRTGNAEPISDA